MQNNFEIVDDFVAVCEIIEFRSEFFFSIKMIHNCGKM